ncbi:MAG: hypothetical protein AB7F35_22700 [Acetobacteraceae bacterium]
MSAIPPTPPRSGGKLDTTPLATLLPRLELSPEAAACLVGCEVPSQAVERLASGALPIEAARLCAHALPAREAVWWATRCAGATAPKDLPEADREARALAEAWVRQRADATRRAAMDKAQQAGCTSPEAWAAIAAFWSGDSMSPPEQPKVPPAPHLTGVAVAGSVILSSVRGDPTRQPDRLARFLDSAREIAAGGAGHLPWETP